MAMTILYYCIDLYMLFRKEKKKKSNDALFFTFHNKAK